MGTIISEKGYKKIKKKNRKINGEIAYNRPHHPQTPEVILKWVEQN